MKRESEPQPGDRPGTPGGAGRRLERHDITVLVQRQKLKQHHYHITPQRLAIISILATSQDTPSAGQIFERLKAQFPTTSLATVYKTIGMLKNEGEVLELEFQNGSNRYD